MSAYTVAPNCKEASARWEAGAVGHPLMRAAVESALDAGLFYTTEFTAHCAAFMGVSEHEQDIDKRSPQGRRVEGGPFAYEVYTLRHIVEHERFLAKDAIVRDKMHLQQGQKVGKVKLNDGKLVMGCIVESLSEQQVVMIGSRGPQKLRLQMNYTELNTKAQRAGNKVFADKLGFSECA